jgi:hypothetical protein
MQCMRPVHSMWLVVNQIMCCGHIVDKTALASGKVGECMVNRTVFVLADNMLLTTREASPADELSCSHENTTYRNPGATSLSISIRFISSILRSLKANFRLSPSKDHKKTTSSNKLERNHSTKLSILAYLTQQETKMPCSGCSCSDCKCCKCVACACDPCTCCSCADGPLPKAKKEFAAANDVVVCPNPYCKFPGCTCGENCGCNVPETEKKEGATSCDPCGDKAKETKGCGNAKCSCATCGCGGEFHNNFCRCRF